MTTDIINSGNNSSSNNSNNNIIGTFGNFGNDYFKLGSLTRRHSVIGCIGFEFANPSMQQLLEDDKQKEEYKQDDKEKEENSCAICLEQQKREETKNLATTPCGHTFCLTCLLGHLKHNNTCPLCRAPIEENTKKPATPISYDDGVMLLNYELTSLRIEENIQEQINALIEISGNSQTNGADISSVADELMTMVASFGFNLLYDALCHMHHGEENVDPEWQHEMNGSDDGSSDYSDYNDDDDSENSEGNLTTISSSDDDEDDGDDDDDTQKEGSGGTPWGNMYQLPPVDID